MRRSSQSRLQTQISEPLIVVEESEAVDGDNSHEQCTSSEGSSSEGSPTNPYLLSPWRDSRDVRKHSLPTPQCSGITASQVRRLSERSGESAAQSAREAAFLATLSSNPVPSPGGRRHSVVTISKVPSALFGRNRRESVAAFPNRVLPGRRESFAGPPSTEPRGSLHNLQLDIMDDIVRARKVRMKMWNTSSEKVCEVQPLDEAGGVQRYTNAPGRRFSDFVGTTLTPIPSSSKRRASELPPAAAASGSTPAPNLNASKHTGIVCSNTDLISILSSLTSSATEINQCEPIPEKTPPPKAAHPKRAHLKSSRSNSFDTSTLCTTYPKPSPQANWFANRHQPMSSKTDPKPPPNWGAPNPQITITSTHSPPVPGKERKKSKTSNRVVWDERSGSIVDPQLLGSAIEGFLRRGEPEGNDGGEKATTMAPTPKAAKSHGGKSKGWFSGKTDDPDYSESCDSSSLCSTLKDLFVK